MGSWTIEYLDREKATSGPNNGFCQIYTDYFWVVHSERGLAFAKFPNNYGLGHPWCSLHRAVAERMAGADPKCTVERIARVLVPIDLRDYD